MEFYFGSGSPNLSFYKELKPGAVSQPSADFFTPCHEALHALLELPLGVATQVEMELEKYVEIAWCRGVIACSRACGFKGTLGSMTVSLFVGVIL